MTRNVKDASFVLAMLVSMGLTALSLIQIARAEPTPAPTREPNPCAISTLRIYGPDGVTYRECGDLGKRRRDGHWTLRECQPIFSLIDEYAQCNPVTHEFRCVRKEVR